MSELFGLWLPVLLSAVVVFFAGFVVWVLMPHRKSEWDTLADEDGFLAALRSQGVRGGQYVFPACGTSREARSEAHEKKWQEGPRGMLLVWEPVPNMGVNMALNFLVNLVITIFIAYLATVALEPGAGFAAVFRFTGAAGVLGYSFAQIPGSIWFRRKTRSIVSDVVEGIAYGLLSALVFALLWPGA